MRIGIGFVLAAWLTLLLGCASAPVPAPQREVGEDVEQSVASIEKHAEVPKSPAAMQPEEVAPESDAVKYLLDSAERALELEDYSRARALADRALRIERTASRAYLVLGLVEVGYGDFMRAEDYARQGLLYIEEETEVGRLLLKLISSNAI